MKTDQTSYSRWSAGFQPAGRAAAFRLVLVLSLWCVSAIPAFGQSPWLSAPGEWSVSPSFTTQSFEDFWMGPQQTRLPDMLKRISQRTFRVHFEYGLTENLAFDARGGYTRSSTKTGEHDNGMDDTAFGVRWRMVDEYRTDSSPTLTVRIGGILQGSYDTGFPFAAGDGASGIEGSLLIGKILGDTGAGITGDIGYRYRLEEVPNDIVFSIGAYKTLFANTTVSAGYRRCQGLSGRDISDPDFDGRWTELKEVSGNVEFSLGYNDKKGRYAGLFISRTIDGRNTGKQTVIGLNVDFRF